MKAGLDIGCSLTKLARCVADSSGLEFHSRPSADWRADDAAFEPLIERLTQDGVTDICVTGAGAEAFAQAATDRFVQVAMPPGDALAREINTQAAGVRQLLANSGTPLDEFMLVSVGSGVSFTLVQNGETRQYMPGLSAGGIYIAQQCALQGVTVHQIGVVAEHGEDPDLLMKHVFPGTRFPRSEFVIGSYGRLGHGVESTPANICYGHLKYVATAVAGHLLDIKQNADWQWSGKVVYVGTPVSEYGPLRDNLQMFTLGLGLDAILLDKGRYACAVGALMSLNEGVALALPPAGRWQRLGAFLSHKIGLARLVLAKLTSKKR